MEDFTVEVPLVQQEENDIIDILSEDPPEEPILSDSDSDSESEDEFSNEGDSDSDSDIEEVPLGDSDIEEVPLGDSDIEEEEEVRPLDEDPNILALYTTEDPLCIVFRPERLIGRPEAVLQRAMRHIRRIYLQLEAEI